MAVYEKNMDISDKVALVTGGADGIGKAIVEVLLQKKAKGVAIVDINAKMGQELTNTLQNMYGDQRVCFILCDVTKKDQLRSAFDKTKTHFGGLDIVCNNAGILNEFKYEDMIALNLTAVVNGTYLGVEFMGTQNGGNGGVVINTTSASGFGSFQWAPVYVATKHGVVGFTRAVAKEPNVVENGVRVSAIAPRIVNTGLIDRGLEGIRYRETVEQIFQRCERLQPVDVAEGVVKLIEEARYNGSACYMTYEKELIVVDEPDIH